MKTSIESVSGVEKRIRVEVPADEVSQRVEAGYAKVRKVAPLRGFRRGKPRGDPGRVPGDPHREGGGGGAGRGRGHGDRSPPGVLRPVPRGGGTGGRRVRPGGVRVHRDLGGEERREKRLLDHRRRGGGAVRKDGRKPPFGRP